jgi:hypothetical protein
MKRMTMMKIIGLAKKLCLEEMEAAKVEKKKT